MSKPFSSWMTRFLVIATATATCGTAAPSLIAQEKTEESKPAEQKKEEAKPAQAQKAESEVKIDGADKVKVETISKELFNPCGIAVQPGTGTVFVADSGNLRIMRMVEGKLKEVITDFPKDVYGKGPKYQIGPLGIAFLDQNTLVVGGGGQVDGKEQLYVFTVPAADKPAIKAEAATQKIALPAEGDVVGEGNFYAIAVTDKAVFVTLNGDDAKGWVGRADRAGNTLSNFQRYLATKEKTKVDAPVGITKFQFDGVDYLAVGQMGEISVPGDSLLTYYRASDGKMDGNYKTGLSDITAVAMSKSGHLYALDFCWNDTTKAGLFRLVKNDVESVTSKLVHRLDKPTAMAFDDKGNLWVTVCGTAKDDDKGGRLLKISGF